MLNLKKITTTVSLLSLGALSVALFSTGCDNGTSTSGTGGAGGKTSTGGAGGKSSAGGAGGAVSSTGGAAGGHGGAATGGAAGGHGGAATGGAAGGHGGSATGGAAGSATGGAGGSATGGAGGSATGGAGGSATGGAGGSTTGNGGSAAGGAGGQANIMYNVTLNGAMEVLPTGTAASTATGSATVILNPNTGAVSVQGSFTGLSSAASSAHIHGPAAPGVAGDILIPLTVSPATAGAVSGTGTLNAQHILDMKNGLTYVNVHSSAPYAAGEIRGQIVQ